MKIFHFKEKVDSLPLSVDEILPPIHVRLKPTNVCAHNCHYCAYKAESLQVGRDMSAKDYIPKDKMMEIIDDCARMGVKAITLTGGGDPFYYPYLPEAVHKLAKTDIRFSALTNGAKLKGELAEVFAEHGTWVRVSIDGWDENSYAQYRGVDKGEFTKVIGNIAGFKKLKGDCSLGISLIVDEKNSGHVFDFVKLIKDLGVDNVKISPCVISNDANENNRYHQRFYDRVKQEVAKVLDTLASDSFHIYDAYHLLDDKFEKDYDWCPNLQILPVIGADMNVYTCQDKAYNHQCGLMGSIEKTSFMEFWLKGKEKFFDINPINDCRHHCLANKKNRLLVDYHEYEDGHLFFV